MEDDTSLSARIARFAAGLSPAAERADSGAGSEEEEVEDEEVEEVVEVTEEQLLEYLDAQENPLDVCGRLFTSEAPERHDGFRVLTGRAVAELRDQGFTILDGVFPLDLAAGLYEQGLQLARDGVLRLAAELPGNTDDSGVPFTDFGARSDRIVFVNREDSTGAVAAALDFFRDVHDDLHQVMRFRKMDAEYQLGYYSPERARYEKHRDALPDDGTEEEQRRVTAIVYTSSAWEPSHGGQLRMWRPKPQDVVDGAEEGTVREMVLDGKQVVEVAPIAGRVVIFLSGAVDHAVLPSHAHRVALTAWMQ